MDTADYAPVRRMVEHAYARATGATLITGNAVRLLKDAEENYPAWLEAIAGARSSSKSAVVFMASNPYRHAPEPPSWRPEWQLVPECCATGPLPSSR